MWSKQYSLESKAKPSQIWALWSKAEAWSSWDGDVKSAELRDGFKLGSQGRLIPSNGPAINFRLSECTTERSFTTTCNLPLCRIRFVHELTPQNQGLVVTHKIEIEGPLAWFFSRVMGHSAARGLPSAVGNLIAQAEALA